jgi:hypothetical protein
MQNCSTHLLKQSWIKELTEGNEWNEGGQQRVVGKPDRCVVVSGGGVKKASS